MIDSCILPALIALTITPQNPLFDKYTAIPPLGNVKAIATTPLLVCAISDNNLILFDKFDLRIEKTFVFDEEPLLVGYDQFSSDLWVAAASHCVRITLSSYTIRYYPGVTGVTRMGINDQYVYLDGTEDRALSKRTGILEPVQGFPDNATWYAKTTQQDIKQHTFLTPYFYSDDMEYSDTPFARYPITAVHEDGMDLYVGTDHFGLLKYNTLSWDKQRLIYGPLDIAIHGVRSFSNRLYFASALGISLYAPGTNEWEYRRVSHSPQDILIHQEGIMLGIDNRLSTWNSGVMITMSTFPHTILALADDDSCMYIGTNSGMFKVNTGTTEYTEFGPDRFSVYSIYTSPDHIYAGGEFALYAFDRAAYSWSKILPFGIKDITQVDSTLYLLSTNNQLLYYTITDSGATGDTIWALLPYFNIYDITADQEVVYCASYAGAHYYEPESDLYKIIYNLPRIQYQYIYIADSSIIAVSDSAMYSLPVQYRD